MRLDEFMPEWQFHEVHTRHVGAPPAAVYEAVRDVRADEILFFQTLTWLRRFGRKTPASILNAGHTEPLLDVAARGGFVWLADDPPHEVVLGTAVISPAGTGHCVAPEVFRHPVPPGYALGAVNFLVVPAGDGSFVRTETRVYASDPRSRRRFAVYWFVIRPWSGLLRRMWLRAIAKRVRR